MLTKASPLIRYFEQVSFLLRLKDEEHLKEGHLGERGQ